MIVAPLGQILDAKMVPGLSKSTEKQVKSIKIDAKFV